MEYNEVLTRFFSNIQHNQGTPIYLIDSLGIDSKLTQKADPKSKFSSFALEDIHKALKAAKLASKPFKSNSDIESPVIILHNEEDQKSRTQANEVCKVLSALDVIVYKQNSNKAFEVITETDPAKVKAEIVKQYKANYSTGGCIAEFENIIESNANTPAIKTGFPILDNTLDGGLYEGVYAIGAITSLGKTTFCLNIAEQIAQHGQDVIIIALEMSKFQLISRSISRLTFNMYRKYPSKYRYEDCKTGRGITDGSRYSNYSETELELIQAAKNYYSSHIGQNIYIYEAIGKITAQDIRNYVNNHIECTGNKPVVIVDYLQLISHEDPRLNANDKIRTDFNLMSLKQMSRDFKLPVIVVSSFNRGGYNVEVKLENFKESGGIDYGCDVILGLQLAGVGLDSFDVNEAKAKDPREIELVFLKNREAATGDMIKFSYYPKFNHFEELPGDPRAEREYNKEQAKKVKEKAKANQAALQKAERENLVNSAFECCKENGQALITDMVEFLGGKPTAKTLERYIKETGDYTITGNRVTKNR